MISLVNLTEVLTAPSVDPIRRRIGAIASFDREFLRAADAEQITLVS
jgi:hypothetical protein